MRNISFFIRKLFEIKLERNLTCNVDSMIKIKTGFKWAMEFKDLKTGG